MRQRRLKFSSNVRPRSAFGQLSVEAASRRLGSRLPATQLATTRTATSEEPFSLSPAPRTNPRWLQWEGVNYGLPRSRTVEPSARQNRSPQAYITRPKTHWGDENVSSIIGTVPANSKRDRLPGDWDPGASVVLQDVNDTSIYSFSTNAIRGCRRQATQGQLDVTTARVAENRPEHAFTVPATGMTWFSSGTRSTGSSRSSAAFTEIHKAQGTGERDTIAWAAPDRW